jgi:hypothetical protein
MQQVGLFDRLAEVIMVEEFRIRLGTADAAAIRQAAAEARIPVTVLIRLALFDHSLVARHLEPLKEQLATR